MTGTDRRGFLTGMGAIGLAATAGVQLAAQEQPAGLRVAFLTDTHLPADRPEIVPRVAQLIDRIQAGAHPPDLFVFGGDNVMNVDRQSTTAAQAEAQMQLWKTTVMDRLRVPSLSVIGNHDIWWGAAKGEEKSLALKHFAMPARFYAATHGGWRFLLLDTFHSGGCELDAEQWTWLEAELARETAPTFVVTHAPILSATHFLEPGIEKGYAYNVPAGWSPKGVVRFRHLFRKHPQVKLALSGHMHTVDRVDVDTTSYLCGGAVSGAWWGGEYLNFPPSWHELLLQPDGTWSRTVLPWS